MILGHSVPSSPTMRLARFAHAKPPGCDFREPGPTDSVTLSGSSPAADRPARIGSTAWKAGLYAGVSLLGLLGAGVACAAPPQPKPQVQTQPAQSKAHKAGQQVNQNLVRPIIETGKDLGEAGKEVGKAGKTVGQEIGKAGKEFGQEVGQKGKQVGQEAARVGQEIGQAGKAFGLGVRDFFKGAVGK